MEEGPGLDGFVLVCEEALDLHEAALREGDPSAELARLRSHGFRRGRYQQWATADGASLVTMAYELSSTAAAGLYRDDGRHHLEAQAFPVRTVPGGFLATAKDTDGFIAHVASVCIGAWHVLVVLDATSGWGQAGAERVARLQQRRLA